MTILRLPDGLDYSKLTESAGSSPNGDTMSIAPSRSFIHTSDSNHMLHADSNLNISGLGIADRVACSVYPPLSKNPAKQTTRSFQKTDCRQRKPGEKGALEAAEGEEKGGGREDTERFSEHPAAPEDDIGRNVRLQEEAGQRDHRRVVVVRRRGAHYAAALHHFDQTRLGRLQVASFRSRQQQVRAGTGGAEVRRLLLIYIQI